MVVKCAWCEKDMGEKAPLADRRISHGQCPECQRKMEIEFASSEREKKYFDQIFLNEAFPRSAMRGE